MKHAQFKCVVKYMEPYVQNPDSKVRVANMGPTWVLAAPGGPHAGHMTLAIREVTIWYVFSDQL